ncbi:vWA domain-containing protein [Natrarchaeobaculum sulfurireducens]|uniref:vWA domain-containing protein n=1 Tax=Natrarchaeobaculum sulfurireducens TaxID=2044521 RepID=UPI000E3DDCA4|nr:vWA domain-containing protein [Natrarchaeobaculum sulfurireducens]
MATSMIAMPALAAGPSAEAATDRSTHVPIQGNGPPGHGDGPPGRSDGEPPGHADDADGDGGSPGQSGGGPPGHDRGDANVTVPELEANTSIETAVDAVERLEELDLETAANETDETGETDDLATAAADEIVTAVNTSLQAYRHLEYVESREAFERYADAQRALADLAEAVDEDEEAIVDEISQDLYAASDRSARHTVVDAQAVVAANDDEFRNRGQRQAAESALGNAIDALERADDTAGADAEPTDRANALTHLENAWKHGEKALDTVEKNTEPTLLLSQNRAFERNDSVVVPVQAILEDVRPYAYDEADVTVDGNGTADEISLIAGESATSTASGTTFVDLGSEPENVTVTVTATAEHDDERTAEATQELHVDLDDVILDRPDLDEYQEVDVTNDSSGVSVDVGGDGLHESDISVRDETPAEDDPYRAGPMVRISSQQEFDEATVEIPIDEGADPEADNLLVFTWDPKTDEPWTPVDTKIDADEGVATAEVEGFSYFSVFSVDGWNDATTDSAVLDEEDIVEEADDFALADVMLVVEETVTENASEAPLDVSREAADALVEGLASEDRSGLVGYGGDATLETGLRTDHGVVRDEIDDLEATPEAGGFEAGLETGIAELEENGLYDDRELIALSTGEAVNESAAVEVAESAADADVTINTLAVGDDSDVETLERVAAETGGDAARVTDPSDLPRDLLGGEGQDDWTNESHWDLSSGCSFQDDTVLEGEESLYCSNVETAIYEPTTIDTDGEYTVAGAYITSSESTGAGIRWGIGSGNDVDLGVRITDTGVEWRHTDDPDPEIETGVSRESWVRFEIAWDDGEMKYREWEPGDTRPDWQATTTAFDRLEKPFTISTGTGACCGRTIDFDGFSEDVVLERVGEANVTLRDSNDDGIPDAVADLNLTMPAGSGDVTGQPIDLDPIATDTSGDGILDNETLDVDYRVFEDDGEYHVEAQVTNAEHNPSKVDTTGDGLIDREQLEDGWEIGYTDSREGSLEVLGELEDAEHLDDLGDVDDLFETKRTYANPLLNDTSGDGLSDREEVEELGTDPESTDTTGDGVPDADADDPTLFDISSPEVTVTYAHFDDPSVDGSVSIGWDGVDVDAELDTTGTYEAQFLAEDQAGLGEARIVQDGSVKDTLSLSGTHDSGHLEFETGTLSTFADLFEGTAVTVQVDDRHGPIEEVGTTEAEAIEVGGIFHQVSQELRAAGYTSA